MFSSLGGTCCTGIGKTMFSSLEEVSAVVLSRYNKLKIIK